jgi:exosortase
MAEHVTAKGTPSPESSNAQQELHAWIAFGALLVVLIWGYWNSLSEAAIYWTGPQYSHGWLVPLFTIALLWMRREPFREVVPVERWWGVGLLSVSLVARLMCAQIGLDIPDMWTFVPSVAGLVLIVGGWHMLKWAGPAVAFMIFMFPLPWTLEQSLLNPLQSLATKVSTYALQTLGIGAYHEGNRICIGELQMGVVDACSGLRMLTIFVALSTAMVLVTDRPWWERAVILVSAIPIALAVNVIRITVTGILHLTVGGDLAELVFHDLAGWVMMPMALGMLYVELLILSNLFIEVDADAPAPVFSRGA